MADEFKVYVEQSFVGIAHSVNEANTLAREMASKLGYRGGNVHIKLIDQHNQTRQGGTIYVT